MTISGSAVGVVVEQLPLPAVVECDTSGESKRFQGEVTVLMMMSWNSWLPKLPSWRCIRHTAATTAAMTTTKTGTIIAAAMVPGEKPLAELSVQQTYRSYGLTYASG